MTQALQFFSSLLKSTTGNGRLLLLWANSGYGDYEDFCLNEQQKIREMRRVFMLTSGWIFRRHVQYLNSESFKITLSGDPGAEHSTMDEFYSTWDRKGVCCVPEGIAKDLKSMGVSSADLKTKEWKHTMLNTASTLQLSMADIEAMHSRNRVLARSSFHSIAAKFINEESARYMAEASELSNQGASEQGANHVYKKNGLVIQNSASDSKTPNCKSQSALELFRKRFLAARQTSGQVNPCSKEIWNEIKCEFQKLPADQRQIYDQMAEESRTQAAHARAMKKKVSMLQATNCVDDGSVKPVVVQGCNEDPPTTTTMIHAQVIPTWKLGDALAENCTTENLARAVAQHASQKAVISKSQHPISEGTLESAFRGLSANGLTGRQAESKFNQESERIARPPPDDIFPDRVVHEGVCGDLCRSTSDPKRIALHRRIEELFLNIVSRKGGVKGAVNSDVLCSLAGQWSRFMYSCVFVLQWAMGRGVVDVFVCIVFTVVTYDIIIIIVIILY